MKNQRRFAPRKTGRLAPEWVAAFLRNQWPESAEYALSAKRTWFPLTVAPKSAVNIPKSAVRLRQKQPNLKAVP